MSDPKWLEWARRLQALAQTGLHFSDDPFDRERYEQIQALAVEMLERGSDADAAPICDLFAGETGYATPKVDVRGAVFDQQRILLVRETSDGLWALPGGWADVNDTPSEAVEREIYEESGFEAKATKLLAVYDRRLHGHVPPSPRHVYKLFFLCQLVGGKATASHETDDIGFFTEDALPNLSLGRVTESQIVRLFEHSRHPNWPTDFD